MAKFYTTCLILCLLTAGGVVTACTSSSAPSPSPSVESPLPTQAPAQADSPVPTPTSEAAMPIADIPEAPVPEAGKASISGVMYNYLGGGILPGTVFYLAPAIEEEGEPRPPVVYVGPREEAGDVRGQTDEKGQIIVNNIPSGKYYLAVWAPYDWLLVVESETDPTPRLIVLEPDQRANLEVVYISWP